MTKQAIELMFSAYRRQLLALLLLRPDEKFHVRGLGRMTGIPAGSIHRELKALFEAGLLLREQSGNQVFYQADQACPIYHELAWIFRKTVGLADLIGDAMAKLHDRIQFVFVFGSMASGQQNQTSDVDVMMIGDVSLLEVVKVMAPVQKVLGREINPVVSSARKFASQINKKERFASRLVNEPKIFAIGGEDEFAKFVEDRKAR